MATIADSGAYRNSERVLPQHQAALTLLQGRLSVPAATRVDWLDLACGRGQILMSLDENLSALARAKIHYWAYDLDQIFARETRRTAERLGFASLATHVGDLSDFDRILPTGLCFDFITLTNAIHEVEPVRLASVFINCIFRLTDTGTLFIYDMERVEPPELGAVPWNRDDVRRIVKVILDALGAATYRPEVGRWHHKSCDGWNVQLHRQHFDVNRLDALASRDAAVSRTGDEIARILECRIAECRASLETLTKYGAETAEEQEAKERLLFEFWALTRALERCV